MRINKSDNVFQVYQKNQGVNKLKSDIRPKDTDQLKISDQAIEYQQGLQKLKAVDEMRMEKVDAIKAQIQAGTYEVNGHKIAEKMLESIFFDKKS